MKKSGFDHSCTWEVFWMKTKLENKIDYAVGKTKEAVGKAADAKDLELEGKVRVMKSEVAEKARKLKEKAAEKAAEKANEAVDKIHKK